MRLVSLHIENFKNYGRLTVDLSEKNLVLLIGKNGQGKTNFLEAIVLLALSKSYYPSPLSEFVNWNLREQDSGLPEYFRVQCQIHAADGSRTSLEVGCGKTKKFPRVLKVNEIKVSPHEYIGNLKIVLFTPQDLNMIFLSPQLRRRYVNVFISQIDPEYLQHLSQYQVILKHRNKLLESLQSGQSKLDELDYWDEQLVSHGSYLLWKRRVLFQEFNQRLSHHYEKISSEKVDFQLHWKKVWTGENLQDISNSFSSYIFEKRKRDIDAGLTCGGPHREDFQFSMNGKDLADFGSRGECRSSILALKLCESEYIQKTSGETPLVLFDDVFSELDLDRQKSLLQLFSAEQVFITTTHLDFTREDATIWTVKGGELELST